MIWNISLPVVAQTCLRPAVQAMRIDVKSGLRVRSSHVESRAFLDQASLAGARSVGVTGGWFVMGENAGDVLKMLTTVAGLLGGIVVL